MSEAAKKCPNCKGTGKDGHDRCYPPNWYVCEKCNGRGNLKPKTMRVIIEKEVAKCNDCPFFEYTGESWGEPCYECTKTGMDVGDGKSVPSHCPFIESTMEKLRNKSEQ